LVENCELLAGWSFPSRKRVGKFSRGGVSNSRLAVIDSHIEGFFLSFLLSETFLLDERQRNNEKRTIYKIFLNRKLILVIVLFIRHSVYFTIRAGYNRKSKVRVNNWLCQPFLPCTKIFYKLYKVVWTYKVVCSI